MSDVVAMAKIDAVPTFNDIEIVKHATCMRFAAVARITDMKRAACEFDDSIDFRLLPGSELILESTTV